MRGVAIHFVDTGRGSTTAPPLRRARPPMGDRLGGQPAESYDNVRGLPTTEHCPMGRFERFFLRYFCCLNPLLAEEAALRTDECRNAADHRIPPLEHVVNKHKEIDVADGLRLANHEQSKSQVIQKLADERADLLRRNRELADMAANDVTVSYQMEEYEPSPPEQPFTDHLRTWMREFEVEDEDDDDFDEALAATLGELEPEYRSQSMTARIDEGWQRYQNERDALNAYRRRVAARYHVVDGSAIMPGLTDRPCLMYRKPLRATNKVLSVGPGKFAFSHDIRGIDYAVERVRNLRPLVMRTSFDPVLVAALVQDARARWHLLQDTAANRDMVSHHMRKRCKTYALPCHSIDNHASFATVQFFQPTNTDLLLTHIERAPVNVFRRLLAQRRLGMFGRQWD